MARCKPTDPKAVLHKKSTSVPPALCPASRALERSRYTIRMLKVPNASVARVVQPDSIDPAARLACTPLTKQSGSAAIDVAVQRSAARDSVTHAARYGMSTPLSMY